MGRYQNNTGADQYARQNLGPDLAEARRYGIDYLPVVFPGFSWHNLHGGAINAIPRNGGRFYWRQVYNTVRLGCGMAYGAMFDEVDEGTAMFKLAPTRAELPTQAEMVALDADGEALPSDWYLQLADHASRMLRGETPLQSRIPIAPR